MAPPVALTALRRDASCRKQLLWRCDLPATGSVEVSALDEALSRRGFERQRGLDVLIRWLDGAEGHAVLWVPATGRVQIRLDAFTPTQQRARAAEKTYVAIRQALDELARSAA